MEEKMVNSDEQQKKYLYYFISMKSYYASKRSERTVTK